MKVCTRTAWLGLAFVLAGPSALASPQRCIGIKPDAARLACFDSEIKLQPVVVSSTSAARAGGCAPVEASRAAVPMVIQVQPGMGVASEPLPSPSRSRPRERHR